MNKVFLIDGHAQIFRMYYAFMRRPMINSKGVDTSILYGFTKLILDLITKEQPTHIAVAFDPPAKTFRHEHYADYKANRTAAPELVKEALDPLQTILKAFNIPVIMMPGYEADDVIGSMATQWQGENSKIYMVTPDKDYGQLITPNIFQYKPGKGGADVEIIGEKDICRHYGIKDPSLVIDILTIWGDSSDNIPGVRGIGEVGARRLVAEYGTVEDIIKNVENLPAKQQTAINDSLEQIKLSKFLATIKTDIELPVSLKDIVVNDVNIEEISNIFSEYEFSSLKKLLPSKYAEQLSETKNTITKIDIPEVKNVSIEELIKKVKNTKELIIKLNDSVYVATDKIYSIISKTQIAMLKEVLKDSSISKIGYDFKQTYKFLWDNKIVLKGDIYDIELMHYIINPERTHKEEFLIKGYLGIDLDDIKVEKNEVEVDLFSYREEVDNDGEINALKLVLLKEVKEIILKELEKGNQLNLYKEIEEPLIEVLANMEYTGVKIDTDNLNAYNTILTNQLAEIEERVKELSGGETINLSSPKQVGELLYGKLKLNPNVKKNSKGSYPTDEETLTEMLELHPIVNYILEYRGIKKLISTYTDALPQLINRKTGKIHTTFNQSLTATGRLSSTNPNLQNIPIRTERGREIRKAFIPSDSNGYIVSADYSQIELRLMAHLSGDPNLIDAFNRNMDIHTATAAKVFKVTEEEVTKEQRSRAKVANFGIIYGISAFGLSQRLGMNRKDSKELIDEYFKSYPMVKDYMNNMIEMAKTQGYVTTIYGRKRFLPDINSKNAIVRSFNERNAINAPLQGSAADIIKVAMIRVYNRIASENLKSKMILQVHDELVFDVVPNELDAISKIVKEEMENVIKLKIPLIAECDKGKNWLEAH
jgi:DNA polymerase I